jgi:hypothetical protein
MELLGDFEAALAVYRPDDAPLRGDALLALGQLQPLLETSSAPAPWQSLWNAYRAHALCLAGRTADALALAQTLVPVDIYEWVHVFETLLRTQALDRLDLRSVLYRAPLQAEHRWAALARARMKADYERILALRSSAELVADYRQLIGDYDQAGLPLERTLTRLSLGRCSLAAGEYAAASVAAQMAMDLAERYRMRVLLVDALELDHQCRTFQGDAQGACETIQRLRAMREASGYRGPTRP